MKNLILIAMAAVALTIFNGCQKDEIEVRQLADEVQPQEVVQPDVYVEDDYLIFKDIETYSKISDELDSMTEEEFSVWEKRLGFFSARSLLNEVYTKLNEEESEENYQRVKNEYSGRLIFTSDRDIKLPFYATAWDKVLNPSGVMKIGHTLYKFDSEKEIMIMDGSSSDLKSLDKIANDTTKVKVFYPHKNNLLKSVQWGELAKGDIKTPDGKIVLNWSYQLISLYYTGYGYGTTYYTENGFELKHWMRQKRKKIWWSYNKTQYYMTNMNLHIEFWKMYEGVYIYPKFVYNQNIPDYTSPETTQGCTYLFIRYYDVLPGYYSQVIPEIFNNNFTFWSRGVDYSRRETIIYSNQ
jgi:hypothetical protein